MNITKSERWNGVDYPLLIHPVANLKFSDIASQKPIDLSQVKQGDIVALIGDFGPPSTLTMLRVISLGAIAATLMMVTSSDIEKPLHHLAYSRWLIYNGHNSRGIN